MNIHTCCREWNEEQLDGYTKMGGDDHLVGGMLTVVFDDGPTHVGGPSGRGRTKIIPTTLSTSFAVRTSIASFTSKLKLFPLSKYNGHHVILCSVVEMYCMPSGLITCEKDTPSGI